MIVQIGPAAGGQGPIDAKFHLTVVSNAKMDPRPLQNPHKQQSAPVRASLKQYGLKTRNKGVVAQAAGAIAYETPVGLDEVYPSVDLLKPLVSVQASRSAPGVTLQLGHVVTGFTDSDRNLSILQASDRTCFVPLNCSLTLSWDVVPASAKHWDMIILFKASEDDESIEDAGWHESIDDKAPTDSMRMILPPTLEFGVEYEFRWCLWSTDSVYGPVAARSQRFMVVPRAGIDASGEICIASRILSTNPESGAVILPRGENVRVEWKIHKLAGITEDARQRYLETGSNDFYDFVAAYKAEELSTNKYAYYWDAPDDPNANSLELDPYYLDGYVSEPGQVYVMRYIRESVAVAQSELFMLAPAVEAGPVPELRVAANLAQELQLDSGSPACAASWSGVSGSTNYDFISIYTAGSDPTSEYISYEYNALAMSTGKVSFDLKELGLANGSWQLAYVHNNKVVGQPSTLRVGDGVLLESGASTNKAVCQPKCTVFLAGDEMAQASLPLTTTELCVKFSQIPAPSSSDYVAVFPNGSSGSSDYVTYEYASGSATGQVTISVVGYLEQGETYELRYINGDSYKPVGECVTVQIT